MTAQQVIDAIHGSYQRGSKNGLENTRALLQRLNVTAMPPVIHVAGTNGKGSTCAMLESVLRHAGYRTGLYTSPFLQVYQERVRLNGLPIGDEAMVRYGEPLVEASKALEAEDIFVTPFEMGTALALSAFAGEQVDAAIIEVGMGGRLDPTNVVQPAVCAIGAIGMDHTQFLGDTIEAIAWEKAGIIKPGVPVVAHPAEDVVAAVFARVAAEKHAPLRQMTRDSILRSESDARGSTADYQLKQTWRDVRIALPGAHQLTNAMTVLALVEELRAQGWHIPDEAVYAGLAEARWPARLEWCGNILLDGAHNAQGIGALADFVQAHLADKRRVLLTGVLTEKLDDEMLHTLATLGQPIITVTPDTPRAMTAAELAEKFASVGAKAQPVDDLSAAVENARALAGEDGMVIAAGSLYLMGSLRTALGLEWQ